MATSAAARATASAAAAPPPGAGASLARRARKPSIGSSGMSITAPAGPSRLTAPALEPEAVGDAVAPIEHPLEVHGIGRRAGRPPLDGEHGRATLDLPGLRYLARAAGRPRAG